MADFMNKLKGEFKKVSVKSSILIETNKIKSEISALNKRKKEAFALIGEKVFEMQGDIQFDLLKDEFETVNTIITTIKLKEEDIRKLDAKKEGVSIGKTVTCTCGAKVDGDAIFCTSCGNKIEKEVQKIEVNEKADTTEVCECGAQLDPEATFCTSCGKPKEIVTKVCNCGAILDAEINFCTRCGTDVSEL